MFKIGTKLIMKNNTTTSFVVVDITIDCEYFLKNLQLGNVIRVEEKDLINYFKILSEDNKEETINYKKKCNNNDFYYKKLFKPTQKDVPTKTITQQFNDITKCKHDFIEYKQMTICRDCYNGYGIINNNVVYDSNFKYLFDEWYNELEEFNKVIEERDKNNIPFTPSIKQDETNIVHFMRK